MGNGTKRFKYNKVIHYCMGTEIECTTKRWGGSLGIIIPGDVVEQEQITEGEHLFVEIKKRRTGNDFFGTLKGWKRNTDELRKEMKKGWD